MKEKRYLVSARWYIFAKDDEAAKEEAEFCVELIGVSDNEATINSIKEAPFGKVVDLREIKEDIMDQEEMMAKREHMLQENLHDTNMRNDIDYFCEYVTDNLFITPKNKSIDLSDVMEILHKECFYYEQNIDDLLDYMKNM